MKTLLTIIIFLIVTSTYGQTSLDSSWQIRGQKFRVFIEMNDYDPPLNAQLRLFNGNDNVCFDSIFTVSTQIILEDLNSDGYKDLLVYQGPGARSNETYYLYQYIPKLQSYRRVKGFENWPNLNKAKFKGILVSTILTGTVEYRFFTLTSSGSLIDLQISEEDEDLDGKEYDIGLRKAKKKLNRK